MRIDPRSNFIEYLNYVVDEIKAGRNTEHNYNNYFNHYRHDSTLTADDVEYFDKEFKNNYNKQN